CVTGLSIWHIGERFQQSNDTISKYFQKVLQVVSSGQFYNTFVKLPDLQTPLSKYISGNPKLYPFLQHVLGALDGTHIHCFASAADRHASRDRK
ncbi:hypothetical protein HYPSUDRAFT_120827, partial [Hypholoma sublateritium FD-334 SS-4]